MDGLYKKRYKLKKGGTGEKDTSYNPESERKDTSYNPYWCKKRVLCKPKHRTCKQLYFFDLIICTIDYFVVPSTAPAAKCASTNADPNVMQVLRDFFFWESSFEDTMMCENCIAIIDRA